MNRLENQLTDYAELNGMETIVQKTIREANEKINNEIEILVLKRIKEYTGIDFDVTAESKRRFSRLRIESDSQGNSCYYWNDGSEK